MSELSEYYFNIIQVFVIIIGLLLAGWILLFNVLCIIQMILNKKISLLTVFMGFKQKIWMTIGLGLTFFGIYFGLVLAGSLMMDSEIRSKVFLYLYKNPIDLIYLGLFIFSAITVSIYIVRMIIIYLCNRRRR